MSTTLKIGYLRLMRKLGKESLVASSAFGFPYRISLGDGFSENPFYNKIANVGEILATAAWVLPEQNPVIFDVGGHCGFIATQLAGILKRNNPVIYSFEPVAPTFSDLVQSITELSLQQYIRPVPVAVSHNSGFVRLTYSRWNSMLAHIITDEKNCGKEAGNEIYFAPSQTLDEFAKTAESPSVIKVDVEGWEVHVFEGAKNTIKDNPKELGICLEWNPDALRNTGSDANQLYECVKDFKFFYLNDYQGQSLPELEEVRTPLDIKHVCNLFLINSKQSHRIGQWRSNFLKLKNYYRVQVG